MLLDSVFYCYRQTQRPILIYIPYVFLSPCFLKQAVRKMTRAKSLFILPAGRICGEFSDGRMSLQGRFHPQAAYFAFVCLTDVFFAGERDRDGTHHAEKCLLW